MRQQGVARGNLSRGGPARQFSYYNWCQSTVLLSPFAKPRNCFRQGVPLRKMEPEWQKRGMQFVDIPSGDLNMLRYAELLIHAGYPQRYCQLTGAKTAPLVVEAESAYRDLDATSANGIEYVRDHLCFPMAAGSFEEGMGA
jgi:hypothetical protein